MNRQAAKAEKFSTMHQPGAAFVMPNAWDIGSARMMAGLGFDALATTSAGFAFSMGDVDQIGVTSRASAIEHCREIVKATELPVSADLEDGFGATPEIVAETVAIAAEAGLVGCTIEDVTGDQENPIYPFADAVERISAAVEASRSIGFPFTLTARAENFLHGRPDLDDTIKRLQAFEAAGADVLYAPGLPDLAAIEKVCRSLEKPVNVVVGISPKGLTVEALRNVGVARISLGSALSRVAYGAAIAAAKRIVETGTFDLAETGMSFSEIENLIKIGAAR